MKYSPKTLFHQKDTRTGVTNICIVEPDLRDTNTILLCLRGSSVTRIIILIDGILFLCVTHAYCVFVASGKWKVGSIWPWLWWKLNLGFFVDGVTRETRLFFVCGLLGFCFYNFDGLGTKNIRYLCLIVTFLLPILSQNIR